MLRVVTIVVFCQLFRRAELDDLAAGVHNAPVPRRRVVGLALLDRLLAPVGIAVGQLPLEDDPPVGALTQVVRQPSIKGVRSMS